MAAHSASTLPDSAQAAGGRIGEWTVLEWRKPRALCRCDCGVEREVIVADLRAGKSKSCGCRGRARIAAWKQKPPGTQYDGTPTYQTWVDMKRRCHSPQRPDFARYGKRGVVVCDRWRFGEEGLTGFECFLTDMGMRPAERTLDRVDNEGDYEPGNCRWATKKEQDNNRRTSLFVVVNGKRMTVAQAADAAGISRGCVYQRLKRGIPIERALAK